MGGKETRKTYQNSSRQRHISSTLSFSGSFVAVFFVLLFGWKVGFGLSKGIGLSKCPGSVSIIGQPLKSIFKTTQKGQTRKERNIDSAWDVYVGKHMTTSNCFVNRNGYCSKLTWAAFKTLGWHSIMLIGLLGSLHYIGLLFPYNWVVFHPLHQTTNQGIVQNSPKTGCLEEQSFGWETWCFVVLKNANIPPQVRLLGGSSHLVSV